VFAGGQDLGRQLQVAGRWRGDDHGLYQGVGQRSLQVGAGRQQPLKRPQLGQRRAAGDGVAQLNRVAQVKQALQVRHGAGADANQGDAKTVAHVGFPSRACSTRMAA
jgi:hypothetical protein